MPTPSILVVAGEPSGDLAAAAVVATMELPVRFFGIGGDALAQAGVSLLAHIDALSAVGIADSARRLRHWVGAWSHLRDEVRRRRPRVALLVDAPEVNLPLARILTGAGTHVVFYIGPQVWAWRKGRLGLLKRRTDMVALILPFEKPLYDEAGVPAVFVGHPILDRPPAQPRAQTRRILAVKDEDRLVALLPGSRSSEVARHIGAMTGAAKRLERLGIRTALTPPARFRNVNGSRWAMAAGTSFAPSSLTAVDVLAASDAALIASGTATLEAAVLGVPMAAIYRTDRLSYHLGRTLFRIPFVALPNWIHGAPLVPELLQDAVTDTALCEAAIQLLDPGEQRRQRAGFDQIRRILGGPGASKRVAALLSERL